MIRSVFFSLMLTACIFPPASTGVTEARGTWPVEPPVQSVQDEKRKKAPPKPRPPAAAAPAAPAQPDAQVLPPCPPESAAKQKTEKQLIIKKLDCLLERKL